MSALATGADTTEMAVLSTSRCHKTSEKLSLQNQNLGASPILQ